MRKDFLAFSVFRKTTVWFAERENDVARSGSHRLRMTLVKLKGRQTLSRTTVSGLLAPAYVTVCANDDAHHCRECDDYTRHTVGSAKENLSLTYPIRFTLSQVYWTASGEYDLCEEYA